MVLLPFAAVAMALNSVLLVGVANFVTEHDEAKADRGTGFTREGAEPIVGM